MSADICTECSGDIVWDSDAGSAVCIGCGILQDPAQVVLDAHLDTVDKANDNYGHVFPAGPLSVGFRNHNRWHLSGESKQATAEANKNAMRRYIAALSRRVGHSALTNRSTFLFERAMEEGHFRYGRKARLVAGSCLAIALREAQKGETIKDVAYLIDESPVALAHVFTTVVTLLKIKLTSLDPCWLLPALQKHALHILTEPDSSLPANLINVLKSINFPSALRTAYSLAELVSRSGILANLPSPPTACAIYILSLEGELSTSLPHCGELAEHLGIRFGVKKGVVLRRYRTIYGQVGHWAIDIPWISRSAELTTGRTSSSKIAKRVLVARNLKDTVQFQEKLWESKLASLGPVRSSVGDLESVSSSGPSQRCEVDPQGHIEASPSRPTKKRKARHIIDASQFIVSPSAHEHASANTRSRTLPSLDVASHMLAADSLSFHHAPTRLGLLLSEKSVDEISDDQLFADGELEGYIRSENECEALRRVFDWAEEKDSPHDVATDNSGDDDSQGRDLPFGGTSRVNLEALDRLLNDREAVGRIEATYTEDDDWAMAGIPDDFDSSGVDLDHVDCTLQGNLDPENSNAEILMPWRPVSPGGRSAWTDTLRFDES